MDEILEAARRIEVSLTAYRLLKRIVALCRHFGKPYAYPGLGKDLKRHLGISTRQISRYLAELREVGLLRSERRGAAHSRHYPVMPPMSPQMSSQVSSQVSPQMSSQIATPYRSEKEELNTQSNSRGADNLCGFEDFWQAYPRKTAKKDAEVAWRKLAPSATLQAELVAAVGRQKACRQWNRDGGQYIPYPATWLNGRRWEDQPEDLQGADGDSIYAGLSAFLEEGRE